MRTCHPRIRLTLTAESYHNMINALRLHPEDTVVVALSDLPAGTRLVWAEMDAETEVATLRPIPFGHKVAIVPISKGEAVIKYGAPIGLATENILPGDHVHVHNLRSVRGAAQR